jgi:hypothetical protein
MSHKTMNKQFHRINPWTVNNKTPVKAAYPLKNNPNKIN